MVQAALHSGGGGGVRIAIIDSGVETSHPALAGLQLADDLAFVARDGCAVAVDGAGVDEFGHGTAIVSVIRRIAGEAAIGSFRVFDANLRARVVLISTAVREAIHRGYQILSCSFGMADPWGRHLPAFKAWVDLAYLHGVHIVSACNNDDFELAEWPGHFPTVLTCNMGLLHTDDLHYRPGSLVEFVTRGVGLELPWRDGTTKLVTGSSYAAPLLSGLLARLLSAWPHLDPLMAKSLLRRAAKPWHTGLAGPNVLAEAGRPPA